MFANIYSGCNCLITGNTGFKGSWLSAWLLDLGARVTGFSLAAPSDPACFTELRLADQLRTIHGDVRNLAALKNALTEIQPEIIFHLAAQALVRESYRDPEGTFTTNVGGTLNILEAARLCDSVKAIVIITSDKCYRNNEWVWGYRETDYLGGSDPYSASKGCAELVSNSYFQSFFQSKGPAGATVRAGNVIGGGDWAADRIVPDCARAWAAGKPAEIRNPAATRPWQHVLEPLSGYLWLGSRLLAGKSLSSPYTLAGESFNFGPPGDAIHSVREVVAALAKQWPGFSCHIAETDPASPAECGLLNLCCDKALAYLDWKATLDFEETIRYTAEWYARFYAGHANDEMLRFTFGQIAAYANVAASRSQAWAIK